MTEINLEIIALLFGVLISLQLWTLRRLNYTCGIITKVVTFLKLRYPKDAGVLD